MREGKAIRHESIAVDDYESDGFWVVGGAPATLVRPHAKMTYPIQEERMVVLLARVSVKPDERHRWLDLAAAVAAPSRVEEGCERYAIYEDIERPNDFVFVEQWRSLDALRDHFRTSHFTEFFEALGDVVAAQPEAHVHDVASTASLEEVLTGAGAP
jgi:quinol monooxygenase YgiN